MENRSNQGIERAVQQGRVEAYNKDFNGALGAMSDNGVPKAVIDRIFVYQQRCRASDLENAKK